MEYRRVFVKGRFDHSKEVPAWNKEDHFSERGRRRPVVKSRAASRRVLSRRPRPSCLPASLAGPLTRSSSLVGAVPRHLSPFDIFLACFQYFNQEESLPSPFLIIRDRVLTDKDARTLLISLRAAFFCSVGHSRDSRGRRKLQFALNASSASFVRDISEPLRLGEVHRFGFLYSIFVVKRVRLD